MISDYQIRLWLVRFLHKEISLDQFEEWLVGRSWNMHRDSEESAQKLAAAIELRLAEQSSGHLDENQLRNELLPLINTYTAIVHFGQNKVLPASSDAQNYSPKSRVFVIRGAEDLFQPVADTPHAGVSL